MQFSADTDTKTTINRHIGSLTVFLAEAKVHIDSITKVPSDRSHARPVIYNRVLYAGRRPCNSLSSALYRTDPSYPRYCKTECIVLPY